MHFFTPSFSSFLPQLIDIQQKSFSKFINQGIIKELSKRTPITNPSSHLKLIFYPKLFHLSPPQCTIKEALRRGKSYSCKLYVPGQLVNLNKKEIYFKWIMFGDLPLMTERGHFILNGSPRVIINQLVRSPGIYYQQRIASDGEKTFHADLIPQRGAWLRLEIDKKGNLWARMKRASKIPLLTFLQAFGLEYDKIYNTIPFQEINSSKNTPLLLNPEKALEELSLASSTIDQTQYSSRKDKEKEGNGEIGYQFLFRKFLNPRTYDLGEIGRDRLNQKLKLPFSKTKTTITAQDILFATDYLLKCRYGTSSLDDIDHLKNRRIRGSGELLQNQFDTGLIRLEKTVREKMGRTSTLSSLLSSNKYTVLLAIQGLVTTKPLNGALREFFGSSPLSQYMDQTNPLAEITHKRRITSVGPGGVSRETAGMAIRGIHSTYYGRICPIETPEGKQAGLVNSITTYARINSQGFLETPYYKVLRGQAQKSTNVTFLSAEEEERKEINLAPGDFKLSSFNFLPKGMLPFRKRGQMEKGLEKEVNCVAISPVQMISVATSLIPFLEHDDANRALMGSNMQRQAVPLIKPERPLVGTGLEARVIADSGHGLQAKSPGFVEYVSGNTVILRKGNKSLVNFSSISKNNFSFHLLNSLFGVLPKKFNIGTFSETENNAKSSQNFILLKQKQKSLFENLGSLFRQKEDHVAEHFVKQNVSETKNISIESKETQEKEIKNKREKFKTDFFLQHQENKVLRLKKTFFKEVYYKQNEQIKFTNLSNKTLSKFITFQNKFKIYCNLFFLHSCKIKTLENPILICFFVKKENFEISHSLDQIQKKSLPHFVGDTQMYLGQKKHFGKQSGTNYSFDVFKHSVQENRKQKEKKNQGDTFCETKCKEDAYFAPAKQESFVKSFEKLSALNWNTSQSNILQNQMSRSHNDKMSLFQKTYQFKNKFLGYTKSAPSFIWNFAKFEFLSDVFEHSLEQNGKQKEREDNLFFVDHFAKKKCFDCENAFSDPDTSGYHQQNRVSKSQLKIIFSSQETYNFLQDKIPLFLKKQLFVWQNIQTDILWHKYSIERSKFNLKNGDRFLPEMEYQGLLPFYNANPYYLHLQNKKSERFTFFFNSLKNVNNLRKNLESVDFHIQNLVLTNKLKKKKLNFLQSKFDLDTFSETKKKESQKKEQKQQRKSEKIKYQLQNYQRSNQATCLHQYPAVEEGNWLEKGDLVANCSASALGELALGKNILLAYMPWDGYNFEDAILISDRLVNDDVYTSIHIERYEINVKDTEYGLEQITANIPDIPDDLTHLNENGVAKIGSWVKEGDILVGKITPIEKELISPYQKLFYSIIEKPEPTTRDTSLRVPKGIQGRVISYEIFEEEEQISLENFDFTNQLQEETNFSFSSKLNQLNKYSNNIFPFHSLEENVSTYLGESLFSNNNNNNNEGRVNNSSFSTSERKTYLIDSQKKLKTSQNWISQEKVGTLYATRGGVNLKSKSDVGLFNLSKKKENQEKRDFLLGSKSKQRQEEQNAQRLRPGVFTKKNILINSKTEAKDREQGTEFFQPSFYFQSRVEKRRKVKSVHLYIVEKRKIQVGDKLAGRHGNKGIVSRILSKQDMPYLPDGTSVDMVLNPLGVPSRMNVGQVFECLLGLAAGWLGDNFKITPFDEIYGSEASRSLVYLKLYQARLKTGQKWLFNPHFPGKVRIFDGRTGDRFDQAVTVGRGYILKLVHMVDEKIHARSTGPYSLVTQQPVRGRSKGGGQRVGEMEVWALEGFGAAYALQELLTVKSDDVKGRRRVFDAILKRKRIFFKTPESFKLLVRELQCLCLDVGIYVETGAFNRTKIDVMDLP